jgi:hypothetical protein
MTTISRFTTIIVIIISYFDYFGKNDCRKFCSTLPLLNSFANYEAINY